MPDTGASSSPWQPAGYGPPNGPPPGGFGLPGAPFEPVIPRLHPLAIASMALGILGLPCCCCGVLGLPLAIAALVLGIVSAARIRNEPQAWKGSGMAVAGILTGSLGILLTLTALCPALADEWRTWCTGSPF
jgi:hypothetical protein